MYGRICVRTIFLCYLLVCADISFLFHKVVAICVVVFPISPFNFYGEGPIKTLRGFERVTVAPGKTVKVEIPLSDETFNWWDETTQNVNPVHGTYELLYGGSSADEALTSLTYIY